MLNIINNLAPFFEDCYRKISVREYARLIKVSPPTASKILKGYRKQGLLNSEEELRHLFFSANIENKDFIDLSRVYWREKLREFTTELQKKLVDPSIVLFGSLAKAEAKKDSDIDIAVFAPDKKEMNVKPYEERLKRKISMYWFTSVYDTLHNKPLMNNIINGYVLLGRLRLKE